MLNSQKYNELIKQNELLRKKNRQLAEQNKELAAIQAFHDKLFFTIAHDFKEPVIHAIFLADLYLDNELPEDTLKELMDEMRISGKTTLDNVSMSLEWLKSRLTQCESPSKYTSLYATVEQIKSDFERSLHQKHIQLIIKGEDRYQLKIHPPILNFIIKSLISNAIKFSPREATILLRIEEIPNKEVQLTITDQGTGMDENTLTHLFTAQQVIHPGTNSEMGSGISLFLCKDFIDRNKGRIAVQSATRQGTVVTLTFPLAP